MSESVQLIVDGFVSLKDRVALRGMREHRQKLKTELQQKADGWFDVSSTLKLFDEDLLVIEEGCARLQV